MHSYKKTEFTTSRPAEGRPKETVEVSEIVVRRLGPVVQPMILEVCRDEEPTAEDASWERIRWDGESSWKRFQVDGKVTAARPGAAFLGR